MFTQNNLVCLVVHPKADFFDFDAFVDLSV